MPFLWLNLDKMEKCTRMGADKIMSKYHGTNPTRRLVLALTLVIMVTGIGTLGFILIEDMSFFDSI